MRLLLLLLPVALCSCKSTTFEDTMRGIKVTDHRVLMKTAADIAFETSTNGIQRVTVRTRSSSDVDAIEAMARGTAQGLTK